MTHTKKVRKNMRFLVVFLLDNARKLVYLVKSKRECNGSYGLLRRKNYVRTNL